MCLFLLFYLSLAVRRKSGHVQTVSQVIFSSTLLIRSLILGFFGCFFQKYIFYSNFSLSFNKFLIVQFRPRTVWLGKWKEMLIKKNLQSFQFSGSWNKIEFECLWNLFEINFVCVCHPMCTIACLPIGKHCIDSVEFHNWILIWFHFLCHISPLHWFWFHFVWAEFNRSYPFPSFDFF